MIIAAMAGLLLPSLYSNFLQLKQYVAKCIAAERMESEELTRFRVPKSTIRWVEEGKELVYENQLYDVKSFFYLHDTISFTGVSDEIETSIENRLALMLNTSRADETFKTIGISIVDFLASLPPMIDHGIDINMPASEINSHIKNTSLHYTFPSVITPPPEKSNC